MDLESLLMLAPLAEVLRLVAALAAPPPPADERDEAAAELATTRPAR